MALGDHLKKHIKRAKPLQWKADPSILVCPNIPKPMHGVSPRTVMGNKWWDATRKAAYGSTGFHCKACKVHKSAAQSRQWMEGHELYKIDYQHGRMVYVETVPLCNYCHNYIHDGRLKVLLAKGKVSHAKYTSVIQHGDSVLKRAGLKRQNFATREELIIELILNNQMAPWKDWRMVFQGEEYPPKFKTETQWRKVVQ